MRRLEMSSIRLVTLLVVKLCLALNDDEKRIILEKHNFYRSQTEPSASDMIKLTWDTALEKLAKSYAEKCIWEHNKDRGFIGENLFVMSGSSLDVVLGLDDWHKERDYYNFTTGTCQEGQMCGHYTQVVWAGTERVGCGQKFCEKLEGVDDENMYLLVCNYEPPGNFEGESPYKEGIRCSECPPDHVCLDSLCLKMKDMEKASTVVVDSSTATSTSLEGIYTEKTQTNPVEVMEYTSPTLPTQLMHNSRTKVFFTTTESSTSKKISEGIGISVASTQGSEDFRTTQKIQESDPTQLHRIGSTGSTQQGTSPYFVKGVSTSAQPPALSQLPLIPESSAKVLTEKTLPKSVHSAPQPTHGTLTSDKPLANKAITQPVVKKTEKQKDEPFQPLIKTLISSSQSNPKAKDNVSRSSASAGQSKTDQYKANSKAKITSRLGKPSTAQKRFYQSINSDKTHFDSSVYRPAKHRPNCPFPCVNQAMKFSVIFPLYMTNNVSPVGARDHKWWKIPNSSKNPSHKRPCKPTGYKRGMYSLYKPKQKSNWDSLENIIGSGKA
ncbi:peptidase inhibitor 16 [Xenopus laevis]|uniref:Peptidase inhibitor 16 n=1 Tax=Xenopus laevis TaxID=8355 RepID=A0A8J0U688_XENLA|nr:peptidase inhibitor 16 [Xenopus laevis]OCT57313.1 hypothetical protein XELAEV_18003692mg [Xenopus laevis]